MSETEKIYLDPDYRREPPKSGPFCCRCQKPIKDVATAIRVSESQPPEWGLVWEDSEGTSLVGPDCWSQISSNVVRRTK